MKCLGLCCGRKGGNSELLLKEALMGAEELGADVEIVRLLDLKIEPCRHCQTCLRRKMGNPEACVIKDDVPFMWEKVLECDGLVISTPVYILTPPGYLLLLRDRMLEDVGDLIEWKREGKYPIGGFTGEWVAAVFDERAFKTRVAGFISIGGAPDAGWVSLGIPVLHTFTFTRHIQVIDQLQVRSVAHRGVVLLNEDIVKRARKLGRHVAEAMGKPDSEIKWMGDESGTCPVCHSNLVTVVQDSTVMCAICGIEGAFRVIDNKITIVFDKEQRRISHLTLEGLRIHHYDKLAVAKEYERRKDEIPQKLEKYKSYKPYSLPSRKTDKDLSKLRTEKA